MQGKGAAVMILDEERLRSAAAEAAAIRRAGFDALEPAEPVRARKRPPVLRRAIAAAAVIAVLLALTLPTVSASVRFWFKERIGGSQHYSVSSEASGSDVEHCLTWLPEGYAESERIEKAAIVYISYTNDNGDIIELVCTKGGTEIDVYVSETNSIVSNVYVGEYEADFYLSTSGSELNSIIWFDTERETLYTVNADFDEATMIKLAVNAK